jgi:hypothetical protein
MIARENGVEHIAYVATSQQKSRMGMVERESSKPFAQILSSAATPHGSKTGPTHMWFENKNR